MKRIFALAPVLVMALSMMVMTASAIEDCNCGISIDCAEHSTHLYVREVKDGNAYMCTYVAMYPNDGTHQQISVTVFEALTNGRYPVVGMWLGSTQGGDFVICREPAKAQPKTGVPDTLPLWFGVMAVSACAYVLTSKKRVF